jgi:hypothetical protein
LRARRIRGIGLPDVRQAALVAMLVSLLPGAAFAQPACPPRVTPTIQVEVADPEPRLLPPLRAAALGVEAGGTAGGEFPHHLGVTVSRVEWRAEITVRGRGPEGGPVCAVPTAVRIRLAHAEHRIRLAREVPPGGCLAKEVLAHERRHAELNRRTLHAAAEELRGAARAWPARAETQARDVGAAALRLQDELGGAIEPVLDRLREAREAGHAVIDTPEEYRRLSRICPEDQRRLRAALRGG